ncbi:MAG: hypothetical protein MJ198_05205 [Bacteroidales bacterium]|nr:hypothetical protein [Bacteroidales bacterium]
MATIVLNYDGRNKVAEAMINNLLLTGIFKTKSEEPNSATKKAIEEARKGKVIHCGSFDNYKKELEK